MRFNRIGYLIKEGLRGVFSHGFRSFASVTVIAACLIIMGSFALLSLNVDSVIDTLEKESEVLALVDDRLTEEEARSLEPVILGMDNVREAEFVTRDTAMEDYKAQYENDSIFEDIDGSVFRHRYVIRLNDITRMKDTETALDSINGVADVMGMGVVADGILTARNIVGVITAVLIVILLVVSLFIMANTIKLATFTRREEIAIMKMVGAGNGFIRFPFVIEGLILGLLGAGIGFLLEWLIYDFLTGKIMGTIAGDFLNVIPFASILTPLLLVYLAVGLLVGAFGGTLAIRNYLKV